MLETLHQIDWDRIHRPSSPIPELIVKLASDNPETRRDVDLRLGQIINHQGDVCESTFHAIPFLIELLQAEEVQSKTLIMSLLYGILNGAKLFQEWKKPWGNEVYKLLLSYVHFFKALMDDDTDNLCVKAADLLCLFEDKSRDIAAWVNTKMDMERNPVTKVGLANALAFFSKQHQLTNGYDASLKVLHDMLDVQHPLAQFKASNSLLELEKQNPDGHAMEVLVDKMGNITSYPEVASDRHAIDHALYLLRYEVGGARAVPLLQSILSRLDDPELIYDVAHSLVISSFERPSHVLKPSELNTLQKNVIETIVANETIWKTQREIPFTFYGLPETRTALTSLLEKE